MATLASCINKSVLMTGTLMNGKADSLFMLLYRMLPEIRRMFDFNGVGQFVERYGVTQVSRKRKTKEYAKLTGTYTKRRWEQTGRKVLPGIAPPLIRIVLPYTLFVTLDDLGFELPKRTDRFEYVRLTERQQQLYDRHLRNTKSELKQAIRSGVHLAGAAVHEWLGYANALFRPGYLKDVDGKIWTASPGVEWVCKTCGETYGGTGWYCPKCVDGMGKDEMRARFPEGCYEHKPMSVLLPKEDRLVEMLLENTRNGGRSIVFCRQTDRRDIIDRLLKICIGEGIVAERLPKGNTDKRNQWIARFLNNRSGQVLFCNPASVETGMNLVAFNQVVLYEIVYRIPTVLQSVARVHRPGQVRDVDIVWLVYEDTAEETALSVVMRGVTVAGMFAGDTSFSLAEYDTNDFVEQMVARLVDENIDLGVDDLADQFAAIRQRQHMANTLIEPSAAVSVHDVLAMAHEMDCKINGNGKQKQVAVSQIDLTDKFIQPSLFC